MAYGSYMPKNASIGGTVMMIALLDTLVALVAGLAIFPIVFANQLDPGAGPGLMFITLPVAFGQMPGGQIFGFLFFVLIAVAAWTSAISLMEPAVAWIVERFGIKRLPACTVMGLLVWLLGIGCLGSFNFMSGLHVGGMTFFDLMDFATANIMLPLGGLFIAVFAGWKIKTYALQDELSFQHRFWFYAWYLAIRYIAPVAVAVIFALNLYNKFAQ